MSHPRLTFEPIGTSYERATVEATVIAVRGAFDYEVRLAESDEEHLTTLYRDGFSYRGNCDCPGFEYHDGPCAHLWAIKIGEQRGVLSIECVEEKIGGDPCCPTCGCTPEAEVL